MKASELIARLQELVEKHGDLPVEYPDGYSTGDVKIVEAALALDDDGYVVPDQRPGPATAIHINDGD